MAENKIAELYVEVKAKTDKLEKDLNKLKKTSTSTTKSMSAGFQKFKGIIAGIGVTVGLTALIAIVKKSIDYAKQQAIAEAQVKNAVERTGKAAGLSAKELNKLAAGLQKVTGVGDEKILKDVTLQLLTFGRIAGDVFKRAQMAALDLAAVLQTDVRSITIQLGKALDDPIKGITALSRSGIMFTEQQKAQIKELVSQNKLFEAQSIILSEIENKYGGQAAALEEATGGMGRFASAFGDLLEKIGTPIFKALIPIFSGLTDVFEQLTQSSQDTSTAIQTEITKFNALSKVLLNVNDRTDVRNEALKILQEKYPSYLKNINVEKTTYNELKTAIDGVNKSLQQKLETAIITDAITNAQNNVSNLLAEVLELETFYNSLSDAQKNTYVQIPSLEGEDSGLQGDLLREKIDNKRKEYETSLENFAVTIEKYKNDSRFKEIFADIFGTGEAGGQGGGSGGGGNLNKQISDIDKLANTEAVLTKEIEAYTAKLETLTKGTIAYMLVEEKLQELLSERANLKASLFDVDALDATPIGIDLQEKAKNEDVQPVDFEKPKDASEEMKNNFSTVLNNSQNIANILGSGADSFINALLGGLNSAVSLVSSIVSILGGIGSIASGGILGFLFGAKGGVFEGGKQVAKFAGGGDFTVPSGFSNDSFPMMVQSGERVQVTPSGRIGEEVKLLASIGGKLDALNKNLISKNMSPLVNVDIDGKKLVKQVTKPVENKLRKAGINLDEL